MPDEMPAMRRLHRLLHMLSIRAVAPALRGLLAPVWIFALCSSLTLTCSPEPTLRFEVSFSTSAHAEPITGRVYVILSRDGDSDALNRRSLGHQPISSTSGVPFFATDVFELAAGEAAVIDTETLGFPQRSLRELPAGDYYVQALLNVYTEFPRADGHVIWAHMDQWDGQHFNWAPGNLLSSPQKVRLDPRGRLRRRARLDRRDSRDRGAARRRVGQAREDSKPAA